MKEKAPLSIRIIYWFTNIILGLLMLVFIASIVFNILLFTNVFGDDVQLHTRLPAKVDFLETGKLHLQNQVIKVELVDATTQIHFIDTPAFITKKVGLVMVVVIIFAGFLTWTFQRFMRNVKNGEVFTIRNISLLKRLAYGIAGFWLFTVVYTQLAYHVMAKYLQFENVRITNEIPSYSGILMAALFLWMLAHIFITGVKLKQENDLTI
jgi:hypothetical protein